VNHLARMWSAVTLSSVVSTKCSINTLLATGGSEFPIEMTLFADGIYNLNSMHPVVCYI
jgi:hypothetical protein